MLDLQKISKYKTIISCQSEVDNNACSALNGNIPGYFITESRML